MTHYNNCDCYECHRSRERRREILRSIIGAVLVSAMVIAWLFFVAGCTGTVAPAVVESRQASFDQGAQNSGVIALLPGNAGAIITPHARDRYNALVAIYGRDFLPPVAADYGVQSAGQTPAGQQAGTAPAYTITAEALQKFIVMNTWHRMGREPKNK